MSAIDPDGVHRLAKLALDSGEAATLDEALDIFKQYSVHLHLGLGWNDTCAGQAAVATVLACAPRAFLGGVTLSGDIKACFSIALLRGLAAHAVAADFGVRVTSSGGVTTLVVGALPSANGTKVKLHLSFNGWQACASPVGVDDALICSLDNPLAGIAAATLGMNEAFMFARRENPAAGHRTVGLSLWNLNAMPGWRDAAGVGPALTALPSSAWLIGLGHLGQAYAWALAMLPYREGCKAKVTLQDVEAVVTANLSTCIFAHTDDIGLKKTRLVARHLEAAGFETSLVERLVTEDQRVQPMDPRLALFGVDNIDARRCIDALGFQHVIEAGLGSGYHDFRSIRVHSFPGARQSLDIWSPSGSRVPPAALNAAYARLAEKTGDHCGVTMLASRAVGTPFVGAMAAALAVAEALKILHAGPRHSTIDLALGDLRSLTAVPLVASSLANPGFIVL